MPTPKTIDYPSAAAQAVRKINLDPASPSMAAFMAMTPAERRALQLEQLQADRTRAHTDAKVKAERLKGALDEWQKYRAHVHPVKLPNIDRRLLSKEENTLLDRQIHLDQVELQLGTALTSAEAEEQYHRPEAYAERDRVADEALLRTQQERAVRDFETTVRQGNIRDRKAIDREWERQRLALADREDIGEERAAKIMPALRWKEITLEKSEVDLDGTYAPTK